MLLEKEMLGESQQDWGSSMPMWRYHYRWLAEQCATALAHEDRHFLLAVLFRVMAWVFGVESPNQMQRPMRV
jgi:hypothetical protein